jgi:hypothetical protein
MSEVSEKIYDKVGEREIRCLPFEKSIGTINKMHLSFDAISESHSRIVHR